MKRFVKEMSVKIEEQTVRQRHTVRVFTTDPIPSPKVEILNRLIAECNRQSGLHLQLVTNDPDAFVRSLARYGMHKNARNYIALVGRRGADTQQLLGYYGEKVVLAAQQLGLNTCWIGLTFKKGKVSCDIAVGEKLYGVISIGIGENQGVSHKVKTPQQVCRDIANMPDWFRRGVDCALLAPTSMNQQKFHFSLQDDGTVRASTSWGFYSQMDLGIARLHFELGAGEHVVTWCDDAE